MKYLQIPGSDLLVSNIALGCMRFAGRGEDAALSALEAAVDEGINFFDHADVYGAGESEELFGRALKRNPALRSRVIVQTKCGIVRTDRNLRYDFSKKHIIAAAEGSLRRLGVDAIDVLLLHRPDALMDPDTVAQAFRELKESGKVRYFGVSNFSSRRIELLQSRLPFPLLFNQLQLSVAHCPMIDAQLNMNTLAGEAQDRDNETLDYCTLHKITVQPWSVVQGQPGEGSFLGNSKYAELNRLLSEYGKLYGLTENAMAVAWLLRHPARLQPVAGTTDPVHIREIARASEVRISREHWYNLYCAAGKAIP